jgi:hypothetical protein
MAKMKTSKITGPVMVFMLFISAFLFLPFIHTAEPDNKNLTGLNYVRIQCQVNGISYYKGFKNLQARQAEEFNVKELDAALKTGGFPITKDNIRAVYSKMESMLIKNNIRILDIRQEDTGENSGSSIIPTVSMNIDVMEGTKDVYFAVVWITVDKWISTWSGAQNTQFRAVIWQKKKMLAATPKELFKSIDTAVNELMSYFFDLLS